MKERILTNWTIGRLLYFIPGIIIVIGSLLNREWPGVAFGGYFALMGLFGFGCASGNCGGVSCASGTQKKSKISIEDVEYKGVK
ncbi:hypothetical protein BH09BAC2_BH09BAC2_22090 [soil metagenome]